MKGEIIQEIKFPPSMSMDTSNCKDIINYDVGEEGTVTAKYKITSKDMIDEKDPKKGYRCRMILSNIELSDEIGMKAEKIGMGRKRYKELLKKREENKEKKDENY